MTSGVPEAFGFVPAHVVADLQDIGNWKSRATAIDVLHKCLNGVSSPARLVPSLGDFVGFLVGLIADPNFKIAISAMSILGDLATKVGSELGPYLRSVVTALFEKYADAKVMVRNAAMKLARRLMTACSAGAVLGLAAAGTSHGNWHVREEVLNTTIMALLSFGPGSYDPVVAYQVLSGCLADGMEKVRLVALEGMAVLHSRLGSGELSAMMSGQRGGAGGALPDALRAQVTARLTNPALPGINADGLVEHVVELPAGETNTDMRLSDAAFSGVGGGGGGAGVGGPGRSWMETSTPARPRPRGAATADGPLLGGRPAPSLEQVGRLGSDPLPGCRREGMPLLDSGARGGHPYPQDDPGVLIPVQRTASIQPFAPTPSRFAHHEALPGGAPITSAAPGPHMGANGWGHPARPIPGERSGSPCRGEGAAAIPAPGLDGIMSAGGGAHGHAAALQPLKHHWGASRSLESQCAASRTLGDSSEDSPLSPTRGYTQLVHGRHSGPAGVAVDGNASRDSVDMLARPASVRTQAAQELREGRGPPLHAHTHPPAQQPQQPHGGQPHAGQPPTSSMGSWLQSSLEQEPAVTRQETFSPSKAEMLARLKNRQIEKRAATAQMESSFASVSDGAVTPGGPHSFSVPQQQRPRYLFTQLSDLQRDRDRDRGDSRAAVTERSEGSRGYDSAASTPTRCPGGLASGSLEDAPASAQSHRPPRGGLAGRLGRGGTAVGDAGGGGRGAAQVQQGVRSPTLPGTLASPTGCEDSPARNPSPALNRLRARSADPNPPPPGAANGAPPSAANGAPWDKGRGTDVTVEELTPVGDPEKYIRLVISRLVEANHADRKELDWQGQYEALVDARRLVKHHPDVVRACLHEFVRATAPAIDQLRSQTSKCALTLFQECFSLLGRPMDRELDEIVPVLIKKAGEVSNAGRDNFLAAEADRTLAEMCRCCGESRTVTALLGCAGHKNPFVRGKVAFHLDNHLEACAGGGGGRQAIANNSACMERLFKTAAAFLDEGSLDTRTHGKRIIWHVKAMLGSRGEFDRLVAGVTPQGLQRKVVDVVEGLNGPPPPPSRGVVGGAAGTVGSRLASRQPNASPARPLLEQVGMGGAGGSLTQPPPPVRQGSYSAPAPLLSGGGSGGGMTPERRRLPRQRTTDLDGIPEGSGNSRNNSSNGRHGRLSAGAGAAEATSPSGTAVAGYANGRARATASADGSGPSSSFGPSAPAAGCGFGPAVVETTVKALQLMSAKDFRERMEALRSVEGVAPSLPGAPDSLLMQVLDAVVARVGDANAKVAMAALELVGALAGALRQRMALGLNTLVPSLAAALGSTNEKVRAVAVTATDSLLRALDPGMLVQHFSHCVANGTLQRGKPLLAERLVQIVTALYGNKPQLVARYAVPAAFSLLNDGRGGGEAKAAAGVLLSGLARLMGTALLEQAVSLNALAQQRVADAVATATGQPVSLPGGGGADVPERPSRERDRTPRVARMMA